MLLNSHSTYLDIQLQSFAFILRKTFHFQSPKFKSHIQIMVATTKFPYGLTPNQPQGNLYHSRWT